MKSRYILNISCPDTVGIVAAVSGFLAGKRFFIVDSAHFGDPVTGTFFMRTTFEHDPMAPVAQLQAEFAPLAAGFQMDWAIYDISSKPRVAILVSRQGHCLNDLLYRHQIGELPVEIAAVIANHPDLQSIVEWHRVPFHHLPVTTATRDSQEKDILGIVRHSNVELVILARYMQVLSTVLCTELKGRCINIHHSFLPAFKGAKPYHQAHGRGVKLIGATAHYVTADLDEGPIIEQEAVRVDHAHTPEELVAIGRDIERLVLARAVRYHVERRVLLNGVRTVVFR